MFDNRVFNVNGIGADMLLRALYLAFAQEGDGTQATGYFIDRTHGMVLVWSNAEQNIVAFPVPLSPSSIAPLIVEWLESKPDIECVSWDRNADHDGDNSLGWRVHCEDWGHVAGSHYSICAVKPAYLWHGK